MRWIGLRSYGIYLWHWPIFMVTRPGLDVSLGTTTTFLIRLGLTFGVAELSYRFVEMPIRKLGYRTWMRGLTAKLGIGSLQTATAAAAAVAAAFVLLTGALVLGARGGEPGVVIASPSEGGAAVVEIQDPAQPVEAEPEPVATTVPVPATVPVVDTTTTTQAPVVAVEPVRVTLIGDSVLKGAEGAVLLELGPEANVDATVSRQFKHADDVASELRDRGDLGDVVVLHLGTNGAFSGTTWDEVMTELSGVDRVIVLTAFVPRRWEATVNAAITSGVERWPEVEILDYKSFGEAHPEYYNSDGVHLNGRGQAAYAELIHGAINR
jgi:lysophospholipase L1-like esterase